ncbi:hypothetical protein [Streptomyces glaucus]
MIFPPMGEAAWAGAAVTADSMVTASPAVIRVVVQRRMAERLTDTDVS